MKRPKAIVAVGASAGGVEALRSMFKAAQPGAGLCYIVLLHLAPDRESSLTEIIARDCALQVTTAADGEPLEPDHVYVVPPGMLPTVLAGHLKLLQDNGPDRETRSINVLFSSLAMDARDRAFAVVLSGFGSDGTLGIKAIKEQGGLTVAQGSNGTTPGHHGMPDSALASGLIDLELPAEMIPGRLAEIANDFGQLAGLTNQPGDRAEAEDARIGEARLNICRILLRASGHDFASYKERTFFRRVQRRMQVLRAASVEAYVERLKADHDEAMALMRDLLISVTGFFRDAEAFEALAVQVIPRLFEGKGAGDAVRVWVPAAATGEEAYSLAMLLCEYAARLAAPPRIQVFATDIDEAALSSARAGRYPEGQTAGISAERLARFFTREGGSQVVTRQIRESCVFSAHSLIRDPPFSRLDLISCRNLLIYLDSGAQRDLFPIFHFALQPRGYLFLGSAESASQYGELFRPIDKPNRLYQRRDHATALTRLPLRQAASGVRPTVPLPGGTAIGAAVRKAAEAAVLDHFGPSHVVVNRDGDAIYFSAHTGAYLEPAHGQPTRSLLALARRGLRLDLRAALEECRRTRRPTRRAGLSAEAVGLPGPIALAIQPLPETDPAELLFLVVFSGAAPEGGPAGLPPPAAPPAPASSQDDVRETREQLQTLIEEHETAAEELRANNEELTSVNEELQSANEELETAKEEQQSVNEELQTLNAELQAKLEELARANADLKNLFDATGIATVILDRALTIRSFTPAIAKLFKLLPADRGRPLTDIASDIDTAALLEDARRVLAGGEPVERSLSLRNGRNHYLLRVLPYVTAEREVDGVLAAFVDVSDLVEAVDGREHQRTLVAELNHRVRNMLQVVIGLTRQTLRETPSPAEFGAVLTGRMRSLSKAYQLISKVEWGDVSLLELTLSQLEPHLPQPGRGRASGPPIRLRPAAAVAMGLVMHELATNSIKYGALSGDAGHVAVEWEIRPGAAGRSAVILWRETAGPPVAMPNRIGSGTVLIRRQIERALRGTIKTAYAPAGLTVTIILPIDGDPQMLLVPYG